MALTHNQTLILSTLREHKDAGGRGIGNAEIDVELNRRHNRHMGYDAIHSTLQRLVKRGFVARDSRRPARYTITAAGKKALG